MTIETIFQQAVALHQNGRLREAGQSYNAVLAQDPTHADSLCLLATIFSAAGKHDLAIELTTRAIAAHPALLSPVLALGNTLQAAGRPAEAAEQFRRATQLAPDSAAGWCNLASALNAADRFADAEDAARQALTLAATMPEALNNLGNALASRGDNAGAAAAYGRALAERPNFGDALDNLGGVLMDLGDLDRAIDTYRRAVIMAPSEARRHYQLGHALQQAGRLEEAASCYMETLTLDSQHFDALNNLGCTFKDLGLLAEAEACFRGGLGVAPDECDLHWNLALTLLQKGEFTQGWQEYEWRWRTPTFVRFHRDFAVPRWRGEPLAGRTILIHAEQGFGDAIQFVRYVPLVAAAGGRVVLECRPGLERLFAALPGVAAIVTLGQTLPAIDLEVPLMSLPLVFGTTLDTIPAAIPYLGVPAGVTADSRIAASRGLKVGLAWAGSATRRDNAQRSVPAAMLAPLTAVPGVSVFSLQVGPFAAESAELARHAPVVELGPGLTDFAATAAAIAALDLVICVDTGVAHLAGALGRPAWVLLAKPTGFLWMQERADSPWYPTLHLLRQTKAGAWKPVIARAAAELARLAAGGR